MYAFGHNRLTRLTGIRFSTIASVLSLCLMGCGDSQQTTNRAVSEAPLRFLGRMLMDYSRTHGGTYPKSNEEFVEYLNNNRSRWAKDDAVQASELLVSPFDGKPVTIVPSKNMGPKDSSGFRIVAIESEGIDGQRKAVNERGGIVEMDDQEVQEKFPSIM